MRRALIQLAWLCAAVLLGTSLQAATISVGRPLPAVSIDDVGEIYLQADGNDAYRPWQSDSTRGRIVVLQHMAARLSSKSILQSFNDSMEKRAYPPGKVLVAVVVNLDDALWGTSGLVQSELKGNKKKHTESNIIADKKGVARRVWDLKEHSAAMAILDTDGTVLFFKEGKPIEQEAKAVFDIIDQRMKSSTVIPSVDVAR